MEEEFDYERDSQINKDDLRRECSRQPGVLMKYVKAAAEKSKEIKFAKEELSIARSRLTKLATNVEGKKPLVAEIEAFITEHKDYRNANSKIIELEYHYDILKGAVSAFHQRKDMITDTIRLLNISYFSAVEIPSAPDKNGMGEQMKEKTSVSTRKTVNKRRRERRNTNG
jgi:hypothetical protein